MKKNQFPEVKKKMSRALKLKTEFLDLACYMRSFKKAFPVFKDLHKHQNLSQNQLFDIYYGAMFLLAK